MQAVKQAARLIARSPEADSARIVAEWVVALESKQPFEAHRIYELDDKNFAMVMGVMTEWRSPKHPVSKAKLLDLSMQLLALTTTDE